MNATALAAPDAGDEPEPPAAQSRLGEIAAPTLVLHGDVDPLVPLANGEHLAQGIAGARLKVYADTGHIPEVERADEFNADLLSFLAA
jgi:pimeloyl-ACP methyl ester carboxylesterase